MGLINPRKIPDFKRTSDYNKKHFEYLSSLIKSYECIVTCPNITTEVDNLMNKVRKDFRYRYLEIIKEIYKKSKEVYISSKCVSDNRQYNKLGLTDMAILLMAKECDLLISSDSALCKEFFSMGLERKKLFDFKSYVEETL